MMTDKQITAINKYLNVTNGREKLCRLVQYFARFYAFYLTRQKGQTLEIQRWTNLKTNLAIGRKFFRLFKPIELAQSSVKSLAIQDPVLRYTQFIKFFSNLFYFTFEAIGLMHSVKFCNVKNIKKINELGFKCWFVSLLASVLSSLYKLKQLNEQSKEKEAIEYQLRQDLCDMLIPIGSLKWIQLNEGVIGVAGMITSAMAMNTQWKKTNA